ncbi:diacylglycerol kinase (ATP) [Tumebacillus sp. BK434]|uniref:diacylglycerol kinase n=1 Tax=Tumebacillus sp. BK434 TaxID=2512169 RepID=UPI0010484220|nr:diacylglycerol kinase [Tumebacillus sp. BK434]TCP58126.1 diacylglycerol kinase (ATP) [Tumebacillus sp. BK434]
MRRPRARLIYNPSAGKEALRNHLPDVLDILEQGGLEVSCAMTHGANDAILAARQASAEHFDYVIAAGGDGTINEVVNGLSTLDYRPTLGILPAGTTNDLGRALGIPRDLKKACEIIVHRHAMEMDVGQIGDDGYFINIAGCGRLTELTYEVPSKLKTHLGQLAYYVKGLEKLPGLKTIHLEIDSPDFAYEGKAMLCLIANSNSVGGFEKLAPNAKLNDGLFDVILIKQVSLPELITLARMAMKGDHTNSDRVIYFQTDSLTISSPELVELNLDGEFGGHLPQTFRCLKHHLKVLVAPPADNGRLLLP